MLNYSKYVRSSVVQKFFTEIVVYFYYTNGSVAVFACRIELRLQCNFLHANMSKRANGSLKKTWCLLCLFLTGTTKFAHLCIVNFKPYLALDVNIHKMLSCCFKVFWNSKYVEGMYETSAVKQMLFGYKIFLPQFLFSTKEKKSKQVFRHRTLMPL